MTNKRKSTEDKDLAGFKKYIWDYYKTNGRSFDWRHTTNPYHIVVSEVMLQQTQTVRVSRKYPSFISQFPSFECLASTSLYNVLSVWQGLGYNRRAKFLHQIAQCVVKEFNGVLPDDPEILVKLPGIGKNTASSVVAFAYNKPTIFIETNIRSVFLYHFFPNTKKVHDNEIMPLIIQTVDTHNPREWYYALMDYGVALKQCFVNPSRLSMHHTKQSRFEGSSRQIRGNIIRLLTQQGPISKKNLFDILKKDQKVVNTVIKALCKEGLVSTQKDLVFIATL